MTASIYKAKDPATSIAVGANPGLGNSREIPTADVKIKLPQALKNPRSPAKISSEVSIPPPFPGQTILLDFNKNCLRASAQAQNLKKYAAALSTSQLLVKGNLPYMVPAVPIGGKATWLKACAAQFFLSLWKYPPAFTTRLYKPVQFNSFLGTSILWTQSNQLLKAPDLCQQPWEASHTLLKWRLWHGRGEVEPPPTAHKQQMPFPPAIPTAPACTPSSMDNNRAPLPCCFTKRHHHITDWEKKNTNAKAKPTVYFQGWNKKPGCSSTE